MTKEKILNFTQNLALTWANAQILNSNIKIE